MLLLYFDKIIFLSFQIIRFKNLIPKCEKTCHDAVRNMLELIVMYDVTLKFTWSGRPGIGRGMLIVYFDSIICTFILPI